MEAAQKSMDDNQERSAASNQFAQAFRSVVGTVAESMERSTRGDRRSLSRQLRNALKENRRRARSASSAAGDFAVTDADAGSGQRVLLAVIVIGLLLAGYYSWRKKASRASRGAARRASRQAFALGTVESPADLIHAVDRFVLGEFGDGAKTWNCRHMRIALGANAPHLSGQISTLVGAYEAARYAPAGGGLQSQHLKRSTQVLRELSQSEPA